MTTPTPDSVPPHVHEYVRGRGEFAWPFCREAMCVAIASDFPRELLTGGLPERSGEHNRGFASEAAERRLAEAGLDEGGDLREPLGRLILAHGGQVDGDLDIGSEPGKGLLRHA